MRRLLPCLASALLLVGCAHGTGRGSSDTHGTIVGKVLLGPTCPVEQVSSPCPPRPMPGVLVRVVDANGHVLASATSDGAGSFQIDVPGGSYLLTASIDEDPSRSVRPTRVEVAAGAITRANVLVDSGIR